MAKLPTYEEMAKNVAEKALDEFLYEGKSIREWMQIIASEDAISRQAVFDALEKVAGFFPWRVPGKLDTYDSYNGAWNDAIGRAEMEIEGLPPVNPQRTGHWIYTGDYLTEGMLKCSECGEEIDVSESYYDFCPVCGAKMQEAEE